MRESTQPGWAVPGGEQAPVITPLTALVSCALLVLMQLYVAIPLAPVVGQALGGDGAAAALTTAYSLAYAMGFLIFGPLSDRYGRKAVLVPGMVALAITTASVSLASSIALVAALRSVQGLVAASFAAVALAYVSEAFPPRWRSTAVGAISTAFLVAGIVGQVYAQAVALAFGWRWVFGLSAPAFALVAIALARVLVEPARGRPATSLSEHFRRLPGLAIRPDLVLVYAAASTVLLSFVAMYAALGPFLQIRFGLGGPDVLLVRLAGLPGMVLAPLAGWFVGRFGPVPVALAGFLVAAAGLAVQAFGVAMLLALVMASAVFVAGIATNVPAMITLVASRAGSSRGGALALLGLVLFAGASAGGLIAELELGFATLLLGLAALLILAGALVAIRVSTTEAKPA
jgi:YNFM family putative membrane transporter